MSPGGRVAPRLFDDHATHADQFRSLLLLTAIAVVTLSLTTLGESTGVRGAVEALVTTVLVGVTLLAALRSAGLARFWVRAGDILVALAVLTAAALATVTLVSPGAGGVHPATAPVVWALLATIAPVVVVRRLLRHVEVTLGTLSGAISAYLLLTIMFYFWFLVADAVGPVPFFGTDQPRTAFMYFSLITITTVGYGDLAPRTEAARLLSGVEAVIGQVYLVTFVARLVTLLPRRVPRAPDDPGTVSSRDNPSGAAR